MPTAVRDSAVDERKKRLINRLKRLEGQIRGLQKMVDEERSCQEILTLVSGVRSALDSAADVILETYLERCQNEQVDARELVRAVKLARG